MEGNRCDLMFFIEIYSNLREFYNNEYLFEGWEWDLIMSKTWLGLGDEMLTVEEVAGKLLEIYSNFSIFL